MAEAIVLEEHPRSGEKAPGWCAVMADPSLVLLHHAREAHRAWMADNGEDDARSEALCFAQAAAFWGIVDTKPHTLLAALEMSRFMLELHKQEVCPTVRHEDIGKEDAVEHDIPALALEKVLSCFGASPAEDPAIAAVNKVWATRAAWADIDDAQIGTPADKRAQSAFHASVADLVNTIPTSAQGAGLMAQALSWLGVNDAVDKVALRNGLSSIAIAFAPDRQELGLDDAPEIPQSNVAA